MDYNNTYFPFLREDCIREFGREAGTEVYAQACGRFATLLESADYRNNGSIKKHMDMNMLPMIAYYLTLHEHGHSKEDAYRFTLKETQKAAHIQKAKNEALAKLPFAYRLFKLFSKRVIKRMYPDAGWKTEWVRFDNTEIHMNFLSCVYLDTTARYGCPELCTVFCQNDPVTFSGYEPKIHFERRGTLAEGAPLCDFHFVRGAKKERLGKYRM